MKTKFGIVVLSVLLSACSTHHAFDERVTKENYQLVSVSGTEKLDLEEPVRFWGGEKPDFLTSDVAHSPVITVNGDRLNILALSGGGANGAFGAGVINGLYDAGELPDYSIITGISAGALIAPFVYTGGEDIHRLKDVMLGLNDDRVLGKKNFLNTLFKDAFTNGQSLLLLMQEIYDSAMIERMAERHRQGKRLFIGTTHFDSGQQSVWNIGQIADSNLENKADLIHQILAASSSIPGVFPPQFISVNYQGETLEELHVDGGLTYQMFFDPANYDYGQMSKAMGLKNKPQVHVIRNGTLKSSYQRVADKGVDLLTRSITSLTLQQTRGDMYRMLYMSKESDLDIDFTYVDPDFKAHKQSKKMFDAEYMVNLYNYGYRKAQGLNLWTKEVPQ
ncbi:phospholipase [Vibrio sp. 10N.286.49.C2]|uniref:patatin-like phospholipase family protein n=1 Tax=unclassified Vibrio TaxID=2614977 RepID=UPI000C842547|nr:MULTISPECIES: patatin-like phospholipase family protein [unclassified Vibrio]PMH38195.1 phospholipase [Vibrio sp. 10N.286.49.C2]PMH53599.1 phospholipase [Vibrio sp. 10N.286.49.B1]